MKLNASSEPTLTSATKPAISPTNSTTNSLKETARQAGEQFADSNEAAYKREAQPKEK